MRRHPKPWPSIRGVPLALALIAATLPGCTPWPDYATGGLAERHPTSSAGVLLMEERYERLASAGAERLAPARMIDAHLLIVRARREFEGGLYEDSDKSLWRAEGIVVALERDMRLAPVGARRRPGS